MEASEERVAGLVKRLRVASAYKGDGACLGLHVDLEVLMLRVRRGCTRSCAPKLTAEFASDCDDRQLAWRVEGRRMRPPEAT